MSALSWQYIGPILAESRLYCGRKSALSWLNVGLILAEKWF